MFQHEQAQAHENKRYHDNFFGDEKQVQFTAVPR